MSQWRKALEWLETHSDAPNILVRVAESRVSKMKPGSPRGAKSVRSLTHKLDAAFSQFIRLRDRVDGDVCRCITCGKLDHWKEMDCGHFMSRGFMSTRWSEKNCAAQCRTCNRFKEGLHADFAKAIDKLCGAGEANKLAALARFGKKRWMPHELESMVNYYETLVKDYKGAAI